MRDNEYKSYPRITPHDEEEDFDWRKETEETMVNNQDIYIVYNNPRWPKEIRDKLKNVYKFRWILDHWERKEPLDEDTIHEMLIDGIEIEK